jgi:hypothetical protein
MEIDIRGASSVESFEVVVRFGNDEQTFNISRELLIGEDLDQEVTHCATKEHFWHQAAIDSRLSLEEFEKVVYDEYQAWVQKYARYYLKGLGEKGTTLTKSHIDQTATLIFSREAMKIDVEKYTPVAYKGYEEECSRVGVRNTITYSDFRLDMYRYEQSHEEWERHHIALKKKAEKLEAIAKAFNTKSWSIKTKAADKRALIGANV